MSHDFDDQGILLCVSFFHTHTTLTAILIWHDMAGVSYKKAVVYKLMTLLVKRKQTWNSLMITFRPICKCYLFFISLCDSYLQRHKVKYCNHLPFSNLLYSVETELPDFDDTQCSAKKLWKMD